jgi:hypothetical protein
MASDYAFGTKVALQDSDIGNSLKNIIDGTAISYWDIGSDRGAYDGDDVVYLDLPPIGIADANDLRLTPFGDRQAGSKVAPYDQDVNAPLAGLPAEMRFLNLYGSQSYDIYDPVYIHQSNPIRLDSIASPSNAYEAKPDPASTTDASAPMKYAYATDTAIKRETDTQLFSSRSQGSPPDLQENLAGHQAKVPLAQACVSNKCQSNICSQDGFSKRLSFSGSCSDLPQGAICLTYSDKFNLVVTDYRMDCVPSVAVICSGRPIELIRCNSAYYYHMLGTLLVKIVPIEDTLCMQASPCQSTLYVQALPNQNALLAQTSLIQDSQNPGGNPGGGAQNADGSDALESDAKSSDVIRSNSVGELDLKRIISAVESISANSDLIKTSDVRLISIGEFAAGTKVLNFDPDQNRLVALPVLVSFPQRSEDYAAIRFYDANGNGLYDSPDDVYLDISFGGSSSFGTVSINDVRLSGPAV